MKPVADADTTLRQRRASDPSASAWVSANAGSGKTKVLVDRVLRLLLDGTRPARILCLTFTKAAAANMAVRVFDRLGQWVTLPDDKLVADIAELEGLQPSQAKVRRARRLFADAVETPGGLKIETIHAFCERVLHIAPFEANVPARFEVLDEMGAAALLAQARRTVLTEAASGRDPRLAGSLRRVAGEVSDEGLDRLLAAAIAFRPQLRRFAREPEALPAAIARARTVLGLGPDETPETVEAMIIGRSDILARPEAILAALDATEGRNDLKLASGLRAVLAEPDPAARLGLYRSLFLAKNGQPRADGFVTDKSGPAAGILRAERDRVLQVLVRHKAAVTVERTEALLHLATAIFAEIEAIKRRTGALDFDDLIEKTAALMRRDAAAWVMQKLDAGVDHLLVDEAQDTPPTQWTILEAVTAEFRAGHGRRGEGARERTVFAVGDPKQSIYGFQGAEPRLFEETGRRLAGEVRRAQQRFERVELRRSFRSGPAVLSAVDSVFGLPDHFDGLSFDADIRRTEHESARAAAPGEVEIWPLIRPTERSDPDAWKLPLDEPDAARPPVRNARRIARAIRRWMDAGTPPGEILVLARKRGPAFEATIRALKQEGVPVAGADRLVLSTHIAVMDLVAAGRAALAPQDDFTLACALKSPLVGWTDDDLIRIAAERPTGTALVEAIVAAARIGDEAALRADAALARWREGISRGPFGFYAALLGPQGGRAQLVARLGPEAADAIDTFLGRAFAFERANPPSLLAFIEEISTAAESVKRELEAQTSEVRVMTVHGAKGLEAGSVVLIDGCEDGGPARPADILELPLDDGATLPVWPGRSLYDPPAIAAARQAVIDEALREHNRLLYVALTRAKDRLAIAPHIGSRPKDPPSRCWSEMARIALRDGVHAATRADDLLDGNVLTWRVSGVPDLALVETKAIVAVDRPLWLDRPVARDSEPLPPLRPSAVGAADRAPRPGDGPFDPDARLRGTLVHSLLQHLPALPPPRREEAARRLVDLRLGHLDDEWRRQLVADTLAVIDDPALAALFAPEARAEVPVAGRIALGGRLLDVSGQIDRLAVTDDAIIVADFKTSARAPVGVADLPGSHVAQVAIYRALMREAFPQRPVRTYLVYTAGGRVHRVPDAAMDAALDAMAAGLPPAAS